MLNNIIIKREGMGLSQKENVAIAALALAYDRGTKSFIGTNGADVVVLQGVDDKMYIVQVRDHDAIVTLLG